MKEDYVSFEVAKLLKEKGFDEQCTHMYDSQHTLYSTFEQCRQITRNNSDWIHYVGKLNIVPISAPSLQMALKWLREVRKIEIDITSRLSLNADDDHNYSYIIKHQYEKYNYKTYSDGEFLCYEEACETAIKYCLINLI